MAKKEKKTAAVTRVSAKDRRLTADEARKAVVAKYTARTAAVVAGAGDEVLEAPKYWLSTGSLSLDHALAGQLPGGIPIGAKTGKIVHIAGAFSTGKSLMLMHVFKSVLEAGGFAVLSETEAAADRYFAECIGVDVRDLEIMRPENIGVMFDAFFEYHEKVRRKYPRVPMVWGIDSIDSSEAQRAARDGLSESKAWMYGGGKSEELGAALRRFNAKCCSRYPTTLVLLNQTRDKVGGTAFGPQKTTSGGNPPHFYSSIEAMLSVGKLGTVRGKFMGPKLSGETAKRLGLKAGIQGRVIGRWIEAKITKNKLSDTLLSTAPAYIDFRRGFHRYAGLLQRFITQELVRLDEKSGRVAQKLADGSVKVFDSEKAWAAWVAADPTHTYTAPYGPPRDADDEAPAPTLHKGVDEDEAGIEDAVDELYDEAGSDNG